MQEKFLHYVWRYHYFEKKNLVLSTGENLKIVSLGTYNTLSGPDFFNAKLYIGEQLWAGNVEMHLKSSDWYLHGHELDKNYHNVILHVVWEYDVDVFRKGDTPIPTLELKKYIASDIYKKYQRLVLQKPKFIYCENQLGDLDKFTKDNWLERVYIERLEAKSSLIFKELQQSKNHWDAVFFRFLAKNFGLKINGPSFYNIAKFIDFEIIRKLKNNVFALEAILLGIADLIPEKPTEDYSISLKKEFDFLKNKFNITPFLGEKPQFFKLRPYNFPTIRLSQLAQIYATQNGFFQEVIKATTKKALYHLLDTQTSNYWKNHYTFDKESKFSIKKSSKAFKDLIIINTIVPFKYSYAQYLGNYDPDSLFNLMYGLDAEKNTYLKKFQAIGWKSNSALSSQGLLHLYHHYCTKGKCLECSIGNKLINSDL